MLQSSRVQLENVQLFSQNSAKQLMKKTKVASRLRRDWRILNYFQSFNLKERKHVVIRDHRDQSVNIAQSTLCGKTNFESAVP